MNHEFKDVLDWGKKAMHNAVAWQNRCVELYEIIEYFCLDAEDYADKINKAVAKERAECLKLVHKGSGEPIQTRTLFILQKERKRISDAIKERGNT
jgi:hypothetical protein